MNGVGPMASAPPDAHASLSNPLLTTPTLKVAWTTREAPEITLANSPPNRHLCVLTNPIFCLLCSEPFVGSPFPSAFSLKFLTCCTTAYVTRALAAWSDSSLLPLSGSPDAHLHFLKSVTVQVCISMIILEKNIWQHLEELTHGPR